jgi:hypothetical protein
MYMNNGGDLMMLRGLREIVVQDLDDDAPAAVAPAWVRSLTLPDGVHIIIATMMTMRRPRRFVVYGGQTISRRQYTVRMHADAVDGVLRRARRPLGAWDILQEGQRVGALPQGMTMAT